MVSLEALVKQLHIESQATGGQGTYYCMAQVGHTIGANIFDTGKAYVTVHMTCHFDIQ